MCPGRTSGGAGASRWPRCAPGAPWAAPERRDGPDVRPEPPLGLEGCETALPGVPGAWDVWIRCARSTSGESRRGRSFRAGGTGRGGAEAEAPTESSTVCPQWWESRGLFARYRSETRGQPCWSARRRPVEFGLPEGTTGGQGRRRQPQVRPDSAAEITSTPSRGQPERRRLPQCRSDDRRTPRLHQGGGPGGTVRDHIKDSAARRPELRRLRCRGWAARKGPPPRAPGET